MAKEVRTEILFHGGMQFRGGKVDAASVEKAMELSEDRYCPVRVMLKASAPIKASYKILPN